MKTTLIWKRLKNEDDLKYEDNLKNEDNLDNEDNIFKTVPGPSLYNRSFSCCVCVIV